MNVSIPWQLVSGLTQQFDVYWRIIMIKLIYIMYLGSLMFYRIGIWYIAAMTNYDVKCLGYDELLMIYFVFTWLDWTVDSASARRHAWPWEVSKSCSHFVGSACEDWPTAEDRCDCRSEINAPCEWLMWNTWFWFLNCTIRRHVME